MNVYGKVKNDFQTDVTWNRVARLSGQGVRAAPAAATLYVLQKFPIIGWLPRYDYRWLLTDFVAGLTLAIMLIPQGLGLCKDRHHPGAMGPHVVLVACRDLHAHGYIER
jgi:sodium-independent sulfate anion transporter 11